MSEQRRWTLVSFKNDDGGWDESVFDGSALAHGESIDVCPVSELDAALAERDALKAAIAREFAHADRLAEALRLADLFVQQAAVVDTSDTMVRETAGAVGAALSAHDARRQPATEGEER